MTITDRNDTDSVPDRVGARWASFEICSVAVMIGLSVLLLMVDAFRETSDQVVTLAIWLACGVVTLVRLVGWARHIRQPGDKRSQPVTGDIRQPTGGG